MFKNISHRQGKELRLYGDTLYWERLEGIYEGDAEALQKIEFMKKYLLSVQAIPMHYPSRAKSERTYMDAVSDFYKDVGYEPVKKEEFEDCLLEEIAAKFGIDIDINGDGKTSFEKYRRNS